MTLQRIRRFTYRRSFPRRLSAGVAIALGGSLALGTASAGAQTAAPRRPSGTVVIAGSSDLQFMNSLVAAESYTVEFINNVLFLPLLRYSPDLQLQPALARSWQLSGDTAVTFNLRRDVYWHDGRKTSAHDVAFTFERARDTLTAFPNADYVTPYKRAMVVDSFTIRFTFEPHRDPLMVWADFAIMPRHLLEKVPVAELRTAAFNKNPVGNGPFRFVSQKTNDRWVFEANPRFPAELGGPPGLQRLIWRVIPDNVAQVTELTAGDVDVVLAARAEQFAQLDAQNGFTGVLKPSRRFYFVAWNGKRPTLSDPRTRRALMQALNREQMIKVLRGGYAQLATGPIAPYHWAYDRALAPLSYDPAAAGKLLDASGWTDRNQDGIRENAKGEPLEIEIKVPANSGFNRDLAEMIRSDLSKVGVKAVTRQVDFSTMISDISSTDHPFDGALLAFDSDFRVSLNDAFHSDAIGGPFQSASYRNVKVDSLLDAAAKVTSRAGSMKIYHQVQKILRDEQPWGFLFYPPELIVRKDRLQGAVFDIRGVLANVSRWTVRP